MPELPEVETIRIQLEQKIKGLRITGVEVLNKKSFIGPPSHKASAGEEMVGLKVLGVKRRGKITIIELENGVCLAIHLKLTGQLIYREKDKKDKENQGNQKGGPFEVKELPNKFTRVIISFNNGGKLYFNDLRMFGWIKVIQKSKIPASLRLRRASKNQNENSKFKIEDEIPELKRLGPEANNEKEFTLDYFNKLLAVSRKPIKLIIMDQEKLAGVGNIYANEALFDAGILPARLSNSLSGDEIKKLRNSIIKVLNKAINHKGSSDKDEAYRQITGEKGTHQNYLQVYGRDGQKCLKCGGIIKRTTLGGRGTFYCENCQK